MMIFTSWMNLATMSFPFQPLIQYRAVVRARRPLKSSTCPASEGSRRYVNIYPEQSSPSLSRNKRFALNEMFQRNVPTKLLFTLGITKPKYYSFFLVFILCNFTFFLMNAPVYLEAFCWKMSLSRNLIIMESESLILIL